jgi:hypothetical protein
VPLKASLKFFPVDPLPQHGLEPVWTQSLAPVPADDAMFAADKGPLDCAKQRASPAWIASTTNSQSVWLAGNFRVADPSRNWRDFGLHCAVREELITLKPLVRHISAVGDKQYVGPDVNLAT